MLLNVLKYRNDHINLRNTNFLQCTLRLEFVNLHMNKALYMISLKEKVAVPEGLH